MDIEKMRRREEKRTEEAKHLEFDTLAKSAVEDKTRRRSSSANGKMRFSRFVSVFLTVVALFLLALAAFLLLFDLKTSRKAVSLAIGEGSNDENPLETTIGDSSSSPSPGEEIRSAPLSKHASTRYEQVVPVRRRTYSQSELSGMPPDVRAEMAGR